MPAVYPRAYGEADRTKAWIMRDAGLSPRLRGSRNQETIWEDINRSIPAPTGKPIDTPPGWGLDKVYPRAYGEAGVSWFGRQPERGLSPRLRGSHTTRWHQKTTQRSIPAPTGKPVSQSGGDVTASVYPRAYGEAYICLDW